MSEVPKGGTLLDAFKATVFCLACYSLLSLLVHLVGGFRVLNPLSNPIPDYEVSDLTFVYLQSPVDPDTNVVIVDCAGNNYTTIAAKLQRIMDARPAAVGLDLIFTGTDDRGATDSLLATLLRCGDLCVLAHEHAHDTVPVTIDRPFYMELTERAAEAGVEMHYGQLEVDRKGRIRRTFVTELHGSPIEPFAVALLNRASRKAVLAELVRRNRQHELINFRRMPEARIKRYEIVRDPATDSGLFRGKIVLMGACEVKEDMHSTPLTASFGTTGTDMSGVELHANTISTMLDQDYLIPLPLSWLFVCAWCFGFVLLCRRFVHQDQLLYHLALEALVFFILTALLWVISGVLLNLVKVKLEPTPFIATSIFCGGWLHFYDPFVKRLSEWKKRTKALKA